MTAPGPVQAAAAPAHGRRRRGSMLRRKHTTVIALLVCSSLLLLGATELFFSHREARYQVGRAQSAQAAELAGAIRTALGAVERQLEAVTSLPWHGPGWLAMQDRREEYLRLLRVAPSVEAVEYLDAQGRQLLTVSRREVDTLADVAAPDKPLRSAPAPVQCVYSQIAYANDYEPFFTLALTSSEGSAGRTVARINLRALADEVQPALTVAASNAYVIDGAGRIVLHRNQSLMLERRNVAALPHVRQAMQHDISGLPGADADGVEVIASSSALAPIGWVVLVEQQRSAALAPVGATLVRTGASLFVGVLLSIGGAYYLASRLTRPILSLHAGAEQLSKGDFDTRIEVRTGDELEQLAAQFNRMSASLRESYASLEQKVAEKTHDLEIANRHKSEFLANMSHELRTPLTAILGFSEALQMEMRGPLNAHQHEHVKDIEASGRHLLALINDVLDLSKIEAGRLDLEATEFNVRTSLAESARLVEERCQRQGIRLHSDIGPEVGAWRADERRFKQVVVNLLSNSVKFTSSGGMITLRARVDPALGLLVEVEDTGLGIAAEHQQLVFEPFRQVGDDELRKAEGTGLGLALVRRLVQAQGGQVTMSSTLGRGTTVRFNLPGRPA